MKENDNLFRRTNYERCKLQRRWLVWRGFDVNLIFMFSVSLHDSQRQMPQKFDQPRRAL